MTKVKRCNWNNGVWGKVGEQVNPLAYWVKEGKISIPKITERKAKTEEICSAWESLLKQYTECLFRTPAQFLLSCVHALPTTRAMTTSPTDEYLQHASFILSPLASIWIVFAQILFQLHILPFAHETCLLISLPSQFPSTGVPKPQISVSSLLQQKTGIHGNKTSSQLISRMTTRQQTTWQFRTWMVTASPAMDRDPGLETTW
jgi:hypothetical protein